MTAPAAPTPFSEADLIVLARALIGTGAGLSAAERSLLARHRGRSPDQAVEEAQRVIRDGGDPLGEAFCRIRSPLPYCRCFRNEVYLLLYHYWLRLTQVAQ